MTAIKSHEKALFKHLITGLKNIQGVKIYGISDPEWFDHRTPTLAFTMEKFSPFDIAKYLGSKKIYVWYGNYYALALMERLDLEKKGGAVRVGLGIYNTESEVDQFLAILRNIY